MKYTIFAIIFIFNLNLFSQGTAGNQAIYESIYIIDMPNAGIQPQHHISFDTEVFDNGGLLFKSSYSPYSFLNFGLSYGGAQIIGQESVKFQNIPGIHLKLRPINETIYYPAIAIGFDSQGKGVFFDNDNRYEYLPPHIFIALSKNFLWNLGNLALHFGTNYNFELKKDNRNINYYMGIEQSIGNNNAFVLEYNFGNYKDSYMQNRGLFNFAYRVSLHKGVTIELKLRDLLNNNKLNNNFSRILRFEIIRLL